MLGGSAGLTAFVVTLALHANLGAGALHNTARIGHTGASFADGTGLASYSFAGVGLTSSCCRGARLVGGACDSTADVGTASTVDAGVALGAFNAATRRETGTFAAKLTGKACG